MENLVLDQLVVPLLNFLLNSPQKSDWFCVDILRRNSVLVTQGSQKVKGNLSALEAPTTDFAISESGL